MKCTFDVPRSKRTGTLEVHLSDTDRTGQIRMNWSPEFVDSITKLCKHLGITRTDFIYQAVIEKLHRLTGGSRYTLEESIMYYMLGNSTAFYKYLREKGNGIVTETPKESDLDKLCRENGIPE